MLKHFRRAHGEVHMNDATLTGLQITSRWQRLRTYLPGLMLSIVLSLAATFVSNAYGGPTILFALLLGMALHPRHPMRYGA